MNTNDKNILQQLPDFTPPESVWNHIEKELDKDDKRRILPYWIKYVGIAAACLLLSFFSWTQYENMHQDLALNGQQNNGNAGLNIIKDSSRRIPIDSMQLATNGRKVIRGGVEGWKNTDYFMQHSKPGAPVDLYGLQIGGPLADFNIGEARKPVFSFSNTSTDRRNYTSSNNLGYNDELIFFSFSGADMEIDPVYDKLIIQYPGLYYNEDNSYKIKTNAQGFVSSDLESVKVNPSGTKKTGTYVITYDADADHVPDQLGTLPAVGANLIPGKFSHQLEQHDINNNITGYINVELIQQEGLSRSEILAGMQFIEDSMRYQCIISDTVVTLDFSRFYKEPVSNTESYAQLIENEYRNPFADPFSTFSIDVDNASYANARRMLQSGELPPKEAVRIEEFVNYFSYKYAQPTDGKPFTATMETASCPWNKDTRLVHIGIQGKDVDRVQLPASNLVFLVDVSGSMDNENKLPLVKKSLKLLVDQMRVRDRVALVTYAGAAGLVLGSTSCSEKERIRKAIDNLDAGGSTAGGEGLELAYKTAIENLMPHGNNRIILVTDGDFNVGLSSDEAMKSMVENYRREGVDLTVCGFGMGNYKDSKLETIADYGNGNYYYIDNFKESKKVFASGLTGTLLTIAKDVKLQLEFNPAHVKAYRLIGYENRIMPARDFSDDTRDAGELGAGHTVTAIYEIIPVGSTAVIPGFTELRYQQANVASNTHGNEMLTLRLRYKNPGQDTSILLEQSLTNNSQGFEQASDNFRYASGVTVFGMLLRDSKFKGESSYELASQLIKSTTLNIENTYRDELLDLIEKAKELSVPR